MFSRRIKDPIEEVTIIIDNEDDSYNQKLNTNNTLFDIRNYLLNLYKQNPKGRICLCENMFFTGANNSTISRDEEQNRKLGEILRDGNIIKIKIEKSLDHSKIIELCRLEYGIKISKDGQLNTHKKAFEFIEEYIEQSNVVDTFFENAEIYSKSERVTRNTIHEIMCEKNLIANASVSTKPFNPQLFASLNISHQNSVNSANRRELSVSFDINLQGRASVIMKDKVRPSEGFVTAVNNALERSEPVKELEKVCNDYGKFWARELILGGKIQIVQNDFIETNKQERKKILDFGGNFTDITSLQCSKKKSDATSSSYKETGTKLYCIGGDKNENVKEWEKSLDDYRKWRIVEYRDVVSIFEILDDSLRRRVLDALGKKIVYSKVDELLLKFVNQAPYLYDLDIPVKYQKNLKDYQIFATILSNKGTFSVQVYIMDNSAQLIIHPFRKFRKNKGREYSLKISWVIIGTPNDFNFEDLEILKFDILHTKQQDTHNIYDEHNKNEIYPLVTGALRHNGGSLPYNPLDLKIIIGTHFHHNSDKLTMCVYYHNLENENEINEDHYSS